MPVVIRPCQICGTLLILDRITDFLCDVHQGMVVCKHRKKRPKRVLHRVTVQACNESRFVDSVNQILNGKIDYVKLEGTVEDEETGTS